MTGQTTLWDDTDDLLADWVSWQRMQNLSERTISERLWTVRAFFEVQGCTPRTMTTMDIARYCGRVELSPSSKHTYHGELRAFSVWMTKVGVRPDDPSAAAPVPKRPRSRPRPIPLPVVRTVFAAINRERTRAYFMLALLAGLRVHEVAKVRGEDFDLDRGSLIVTGKGGKTQLIPLAPELRELAERMPRRGYWFPAYTIEGCVTRDAVGRAGDQECDGAGRVPRSRAAPAQALLRHRATAGRCRRAHGARADAARRSEHHSGLHGAGVGCDGLCGRTVAPRGIA